MVCLGMFSLNYKKKNIIMKNKKIIMINEKFPNQFSDEKSIVLNSAFDGIRPWSLSQHLWMKAGELLDKSPVSGRTDI